ncbi:MAG: PAS domain S-box protein [Planctomycetes bacterium]|nr:PAS domain S-box protein [Planctomycetota bacterium]
MLEDTAELPRMEESVQVSEVRYRRLFESSKDGILILDAATAKITDANPFISELLGFSQSELIGKELWEIGLFKDVEESKEAMQKLQADGYIRYEDLPLETKAGKKADVEFVSNVYTEGHHTVIQCNIRDITDRKRVEQALHESHTRFESLFDASPVGMYLVDGTLRIRLVSRTARPVFGEIGELIGRDFLEVIHILWPPQRADEIVARFRHTLETGEPYVAPEFSAERFDLKVIEYYDWQIHRVSLADGDFGVVCYFVDISERMRMSNELRQYSANLSESDRRKNEFLAMLAHELRNPLAPIRHALQIMRLTENRDGLNESNGIDAQASPRSASYEMMERQVGQLVRLVDDLLDVSRISRGNIELRRERVELAAVVHQAVEATRALYQGMEHNLTAALPSQPIYLSADPTRLAQVVGNLLNNACKFTDKGGRISLTVTIEQQMAVLRVQDNGIGIASKLLPRLFDMFMQVDTSLERSISGLGIGLTLVKNLVELHGGTVEVHSDGIGQGSEFVVRLPILEEAPIVPPAVPTAGEPTTLACRILVVDDNRDSAKSLAMLLTLSDNETRTAYDGLEALEAAATFRPNVILLDIGLPKLNGFEVCRHIRLQTWGKDMVLVALTGWGQDEDRQKSLDAGFNAHMVKPVGHAALTKLLAELLPLPVECIQQNK